MNKQLKFYSVITLLLSAVFTNSNAALYYGSDIELSGQDYSASQHFTSGSRAGTNRWFDVGTDGIYSPWASWIEYTVDLDAGNWNIGLNVINNGNLEEGSGWYDNFLVRDNYGHLLDITASDTEVHHDFFNYDIDTSGEYTFRFHWLNDKWGGSNDPLRRDANIQIDSVFFDNTATVPEPSVLALMAFGLAGLGFTHRRKLQK